MSFDAEFSHSVRRKGEPLKPGEFKGYCRLGTEVDADLITREQWEMLDEYPPEKRTTRIYRGKQFVSVPHDLTFTDQREFEAHMKEAHNKSGVQLSDGGKLSASVRRGPTKLRLKANGVDLHFTWGKPGSVVAWTQLTPSGEKTEVLRYCSQEKVERWVPEPAMERTLRTGVVWSEAPGRQRIWVVPDELLDGEVCVLLERDGNEWHYVSTVHPRRKAASVELQRAG